MIKNFTIYGERHTGTNLLEASLTGISFYHKDKVSADIPVTWDYGWKHFFGWKNEEIKKQGQNTLFLGIVRNPYDWIMAMHNIKHHIPKTNYELHNFLTNEWYSVSRNKNTKPSNQIRTAPFFKPKIKQQKVFEEIITDRNLKTKERYRNIFELRAVKLDYLYNTMPTIAQNYEFIRYEDLCSQYPTIITNILDKYQINYSEPSIQIKDKKPYAISQEVKTIIDTHIDWDIENQVGYNKR